MLPGRRDGLLARGVAYGHARLVLGMHFPSDVAAGRRAGALIVERLRATPSFAAPFAEARNELSARFG